MNALRFLVLVGAASLLMAAEPGPPTKLEWDHSGLAEDGTPITLVESETGIWDAAGVTLMGSRKIPICKTTGSMTCQETLADLGLAPGTYVLKERVIGVNGIPSVWSAPLLYVYDPRAPAAPTNCRFLR